MECMADQGWEVEELSEDGGFGAPEMPEEQAGLMAEAAAACGEAASPRPENFTQAEWEQWYESLMETGRCLEAEGFALADQPTLQRFIDELGQWSPYGDLLQSGAVQGFDLPALQEVCPEEPFWPGPR